MPRTYKKQWLFKIPSLETNENEFLDTFNFLSKVVFDFLKKTLEYWI